MLSGRQAIFVADRTVPLPELLDRLGIEYGSIPGTICCPVHKFGLESRPSAHIYEDNHIFCFACNRQYGPVAVFAANKGVSEEDAAARLLVLWPPAEADRFRLLRAYQPPAVVPASEQFCRYADGRLRRFRLRVSLARYRGWAGELAHLLRSLEGLAPRDQIRRVEFFCGRLEADLGRSTRDPLPGAGAGGVLPDAGPTGAEGPRDPLPEPERRADPGPRHRHDVA